MKNILFMIMMVFCLTSCEQYVTRKFGGTTTVKLEPGQKFVECTWKGDANLWYLVEPMDSDYVPKTKEFIESSMFGAIEGKVIFIETR